jgi:hypothetical protein
MEASARIFFTNNALTVNLIPALVIIGLLLFREYIPNHPPHPPLDHLQC